MQSILKKIFYLFFPLAIGLIVSLLISQSIDYTNLARPPLAPPKILFPISWTIIYLLMGISYFIFRKKVNHHKYESLIYYIQLFINAFWSIFFFLLKWRLFSVTWILLLDIAVIYMIYLFYQKEKVAAYLNILYLVWILFATYLTIGIYLLN